MLQRDAKKKTPRLGVLPGWASCSRFAASMRLVGRPALKDLIPKAAGRRNQPIDKSARIPPVLRKEKASAPVAQKAVIVLLHCGELTPCEGGSEPREIAYPTSNRRELCTPVIKGHGTRATAGPRIWIGHSRVKQVGPHTDALGGRDSGSGTMPIRIVPRET